MAACLDKSLLELLNISCDTSARPSHCEYLDLIATATCRLHVCQSAVFMLPQEVLPVKPE